MDTEYIERELTRIASALEIIAHHLEPGWLARYNGYPGFSYDYNPLTKERFNISQPDIEDDEEEDSSVY